VLFENGVGVLPRRQQKGRHRWRHRRRDFRDQFVGDHARPAGHRRHQAERRRAALHRQPRLLDARDAADLDEGKMGQTHRRRSGVEDAA
jgi:hypothetical protein